MTDVLAVISAATRLAAWAVELMGVVEDLKEASTELESYRQQLNDLKKLATSISENPVLQTDEIQGCIKSILDLKQDKLATITTKNKVQRVIYFRSHDKTISKVFAELEQRKLSLSLAINVAGSNTLQGIQCSITALSEATKNEGGAGIIENLDIGGGDVTVGLQAVGNVPVEDIRNTTIIRDLDIRGPGKKIVGADVRVSGHRPARSRINLGNLVGHISNIRVISDGPSVVGANLTWPDSPTDTQ
ncbi:hypothetical protein NQ176_g259 [Zarea fungicola]|uniref:Uncharacterized protein n=1 Tax=Zarea fungicola TaxID=93591 RepID=A0ACC1NXY6_9HYPO|nr:hypothetical protein NQ176_g259 [Lecanicillium fungicola]